ncbi:hypothetical protein BDQ12DRAFT_708041 [Crucibulum laeve]|uniref:SET domain-containing protein n=1 Tax=Crucibulum laeve TaxID=68775 RepID=A0A5C3LR75_9AGAR|nr:hypothetical protein BDQ12DRAFT_708041 [Crucibulum laeve]
MKRGFLNRAKAKKALSSTTRVVHNTPIDDYPRGTKFSYGKVADAGPPEGYTEHQTFTKEMNAERLDHPEGRLLYTTIPAQYSNSSYDDEPIGWSECLITGSVKRQIYETPEFGRAPPQSDRVSFRIRPTPDMGLGMFATCSLKMGDLILSERPLIVTPVVARPDVQIPRSFTHEQIRQVILFEWEKNLEICVDRMFPENRKAFYTLANAHTEDGSGPIMGRIRTNGYGVIEKLYDKELAHLAVCDKLSYINHSCRPNVTQDFDVASFSFQLRASRDIKPDEQLFYSYCEVDSSATDRKRQLARYGFECICASCSGDTANSDYIRMNVDALISQNKIECEAWTRKPRHLRDDSVLRSSLDLLSDVENEGLHSSDSYPILVRSISEIYTQLGDMEDAKSYLHRQEAWKTAFKA